MQAAATPRPAKADATRAYLRGHPLTSLHRARPLHRGDSARAATADTNPKRAVVSHISHTAT